MTRRSASNGLHSLTAAAQSQLGSGGDTAAMPYAELAPAIYAGLISAQEVVNDSIARAYATEALAAWTYIDPEAAVAEAIKRDFTEAESSGNKALRGLTFGVKESIAVGGMPFEAGSDVFRGDIAKHDAAVVGKLRQAGAIPLGMTAMHALGLGDAVEFGHRSTSRHPWHEDYVPSGSSSGAAVATAAGSCSFAVGGDTGGSVRGPAASCGVFGLKPSSDRVDSSGTTSMAWSMDTIGFFARDLIILEEICRELDLLSEAEVTGEHARVGVFASERLTGASSEIVGIYSEATQRLREAGNAVSEVSIPTFDDAPKIWLSRMAEFRSVLSREMAIAPERIPVSMRRVFEASSTVSRSDYHDSWRAGVQLTRETDEALSEVDVLLLPAAPTRTLTWSDWTGSGLAGTRVSDWYRYLLPFNIRGHPAITLPWVLLDGVVPTSVQLIARHGHEQTLLAVAEHLHDLSGWQNIVPFRVDELLQMNRRK